VTPSNPTQPASRPTASTRSPSASWPKQASTSRIIYVVTVCDHAHEHCPLFPGKARVIHVGFDDPPRLARDAKSEDEALAHYRRVRDEIRAFVERLPDAIGLGRKQG
jgi:protein-tyrosine-phosphatase